MYKILLSNKSSGEVVYVKSPEELISFANEELKKINEKTENKNDDYFIRELALDPDARSVFNGDEIIYLPPRDYDVLDYLVSKKGHLVTYKELYEQLWQAQGETDEHSVIACVHRLRSKIEPNKKKPIFIHNVWGAGYRYL